MKKKISFLRCRTPHTPTIATYCPASEPPPPPLQYLKQSGCGHEEGENLEQNKLAGAGWVEIARLLFSREILCFFKGQASLGRKFKSRLANYGYNQQEGDLNDIKALGI